MYIVNIFDMSDINHTHETLVQTDHTHSDNNMQLQSYIFWRYEFNVDTDVHTKKKVNYPTTVQSWSNYTDHGNLNVYNKQ